jgi:hypothetical protein
MYETPAESHEVTLDVVDRWLVRACESLLTTWDENKGNFWRDSWQDQGDASGHETEEQAALGRGKGATSNNRSFQALVAAAYFFSENAVGNHDAGLPERIQAAARGMVKNYFSLPLEWLRGHGENGENPYTNAQLLLSLSLALSPVTAITCGLTLDADERATLVGYLQTLTKVVLAQLSAEGVKVHTSARVHHFLTLHSVRALDAAARTLKHVAPQAGPDGTFEHTSLLNRVRDEIVQQLGLHLLPAPGFDSSSLVSCCALLARFTGDADSPVIEEGIAALVKDQSERGTWTSAGVLSFGHRRLVYIPSVELSFALCCLALLDLQESDMRTYSAALPALDASFRLVRSSFAIHREASGWRNDRTCAGYEVESWTTAVVVQFLIAYRDALRLARQEKILLKYRATRRSASFVSFWADLNWLVPRRERYEVLTSRGLPLERLDRFDSWVDPTKTNSIVRGIQAGILEPTLYNVNERPVETASFLLYGPPGTRKTSLVAAAAEALDWPLLTLSPPVFLTRGIEGFEAAADEIFEDLMHLRRTVVLFDECEEFFKWRPSSTPIESRTVGAFITSGMLPRLQRLRDNRWIVFVINSNAEAFELDDAVTRRGRLDKAARMGHPVLAAQLRYLRAWRSRSTGAHLDEVRLGWFSGHLEAVDEQMGQQREQLDQAISTLQREHPGRGDAYRRGMAELDRDVARLPKLVTFSSLDSLAERCLGEGSQSSITSAESLLENLNQEFVRFGPDSFNPS